MTDIRSNIRSPGYIRNYETDEFSKMAEDSKIDVARAMDVASRNNSRPAMNQDWHPDHNIPEPEHDGTILK